MNFQNVKCHFNLYLHKYVIDPMKNSRKHPLVTVFKSGIC